MATWPLATVSDDGHRVGVAAALGTGGTRVAELLARIATAQPPPSGLEIATLAAATPAGAVAEPVVLVSVAEAVDATAWVDRAWLGAVERRRSAPRATLTGAGRGTELEAALHLAMLLATTPVGDTGGSRVTESSELSGADARVASGARLWLLGGAVAWALTGDDDDPFSPWGDLVSFGLWPVGPVDGRLIVGRDRVQATQAGDRVQATQAGDRVQATQAGNGVQAEQGGR